VTQVAFAYAAIAWLLLQVGEIVFKALLLPGWSMRLLLALLLLGFPLAVGLAWFFDLTPTGVSRTAADVQPASEGSPAPRSPEAPNHDAGWDGVHERRAAGTDAPRLQLRKLWLPVGLTLVVGITLGALTRLRRDPPPPPAQRAASIAILPFTSLSNDKTDAYFAEGLAVELQDALASVKGLKVAALGSGASPAGRDLKQLGRTLGVATVLNASVRRDGTRVRTFPGDRTQLFGAEQSGHPEIRCRRLCRGGGAVPPGRHPRAR
ncbi:MAG TPA: hypothetical protein VNI56_04690, partial [Xanthomonadaceae bacterium]|nr:hypothetical protein [Xanthomonadaceae bacterium]